MNKNATPRQVAKLTEDLLKVPNWRLPWKKKEKSDQRVDARADRPDKESNVSKSLHKII